MEELSEIEIKLDSVQEGLKLWISSKRDGTLFDGIETAIENNEADATPLAPTAVIPVARDAVFCPKVVTDD